MIFSWLELVSNEAMFRLLEIYRATWGVIPGLLCHLGFQVHEAILWAIFAPAGHRFNVFLRRRAPADLRIAYRLSSFFFLANVV